MSFKLLNKYLTFELNQQIYGIEIANVSEIISIKDITPVPQTPDFVEGMINVRGKVIPIINLRKKFALPDKEHDRNTCIIIINILSVLSSADVKENQMGVIVDTVFEVLDIDESLTEEAPQFGNKTNTEFIQAIAKDEEGIKILLDIEKVLTHEELVVIRDLLKPE